LKGHGDAVPRYYRQNLTAYEHNPSAMALQGLAASGSADAVTISQSVSYLLSAQNVDRGWSFVKGETSRVYYTALIMQALEIQSQTTSIAQATSRAIRFLVTHQNADGSFGSIFETTLSYSALAAVSTDATVLGNAINYLTSRKSADGSWEGVKDKILSHKVNFLSF